MSNAHQPLNQNQLQVSDNAKHASIKYKTFETEIDIVSTELNSPLYFQRR